MGATPRLAVVMVVGEERERARRAVAAVRERPARDIDFGRVRPELEGWSTGRTAAQVLATPLAGGRATAATLRAAGAAWLRLGPGGSATVLTGQLAWVAGEAIGYAGAIRSAPATV
jgi:hypothetical protein